MAALTVDIASWRVLIVDDKPDNLKLITIVLESRRAMVRAITDSQQVFAIIDEFAPNLILLDLAMPHLNGWEIYQKLRTRPEMARVPIIALTALSAQNAIDRGYDTGLDGYITKPYRTDAVVQQITEYVKAFLERQN